MRSEGLCNRIGKEEPKEVKIWPFPGFGSKGPKWGLKTGSRRLRKRCCRMGLVGAE